jgi:phage shock protein C
MNMADEIERLHKLHLAGALTDLEFAEAKRKLLDGATRGPLLSPDVSAQINRMRRSKSDRWLGGVCGGLGKLTAVESWIWRLIFAIAAIGGGVGVLLYIVAWIFIPEEELGTPL